MKIKRLGVLKYSLLKVCLLISGKQNTLLENLNNYKSERNFRQLLKLLYNFHYSRKKILFVIPKYLYNSKYSVYIKNSHHYVFLKNSWLNGLVCNRKYVNSNKDENARKLFESSIVVIFDAEKKDMQMLNEFNSLDVPVVCCGISDQD